MAALNKTDLDFLASLPASTAEPAEGTREQRRWAENLPWGLLCQGRRTDLGDFVVAQRADLERLTADLKEARLTLAAEQGQAEGAPCKKWKYDPRYREWSDGAVWVRRLRGRWVWRQNVRHHAKRGEEQTARAAMLAADAATEAR